MDEHTSPVRRASELMSGALGFIAGLLPHILHHIGLIAGAAFLTGVAGSVIFGLVGLVLTIPLLLRLYRKFATLAAPLIALALFIAMFLLSSLVIGPWIRGDRGKSAIEQPTDSHSQHH